MKEILKNISELAIANPDFSFAETEIKTKWLGNKPATENEIKEAEERLGLTLPDDYKDFLLITNGFSTPNENIEPSFEKVQSIDFLKEIDPQLIEAWSVHENLALVAIQLSRSILVGGLNDEQCFLLIPPTYDGDSWMYWKFASWIPGEDPYEGMENYFINVLDFLKSA